jgi:hypothetical protein
MEGRGGGGGEAQGVADPKNKYINKRADLALAEWSALVIGSACEVNGREIQSR